MRATQSLRGRRFGRLVVSGVEPEMRACAGRRRRYWECSCDCGSIVAVRHDRLLDGNTSSCGCAPKVTPKHGHNHAGSRTGEYRTWDHMIQRCTNASNKRFKDYGGRGIRVCDRWRESFEAFLADMGPRPSPGHSIDRIDANGHYEPGNCRWATAAEQSRNTSRNRWVNLFGERMVLRDAATRLGVSYETLRHRVNRGARVHGLEVLA